MASLNRIASNILDDVRDGIAWIAVWKDGRKWMSETFYPELDDDCLPVFDKEDKFLIGEDVEIDARCIMVNSYYHNIGGMEDATVESIAEALRWQYERGSLLASNHI